MLLKGSQRNGGLAGFWTHTVLDGPTGSYTVLRVALF